MADRYQIMIDIETLGKSPSAVVLSVGAVVMDMQELTIVDKAYWVLDVQEQDNQGRSIDAETVVWWLQQEESARQAFHKLVPRTKCEDFVQELDALFKKWATKTPWANGTNFDLPILANFIEDNIHTSVAHSVPWGYRHQDMRSLATAMAEVKPYDQFYKVHGGTTHNALDDAERQAMYVLECKKWIRQRG